jgi:transcriptional regulator with XRE-family HTH domain
MAAAVQRILDDLRSRGGLLGKDVANIVGTSTPTVSRWSTGQATPPIEAQTLIAALRYVVDRLADFYTPEEIRIWLHAVHPLLHGERAIDAITSGRTAEVLAVIDRLDSGAYL